MTFGVCWSPVALVVGAAEFKRDGVGYLPSLADLDFAFADMANAIMLLKTGKPVTGGDAAAGHDYLSSAAASIR